MSEIMEAASDPRPADRDRRKNKFKFTSFPDYVRKVQQLSSSQSVTTANSEGKQLPSGIHNLSRAFSCFTTSSNSPNLPCKTSDAVKKPRLPPLHASRRKQQVKKLQLKSCTGQEDTTSSNNSSPLRPTAFDHLRTQEVAIYRASSFPLINDCTDCSKATTAQNTKPKRPVMSKSPYLQPLVHKSYYHKESSSVVKTPKGQWKKRVKQQKVNITDDDPTVATMHEAPEDKQEESHTKDESHNKDNSSLLIPSITLRAATPSANSDDMSTSLVDQFTARKQLADELDKLNREIQDIVVSVEQVE